VCAVQVCETLRVPSVCVVRTEGVWESCDTKQPAKRCVFTKTLDCKHSRRVVSHRLVFENGVRSDVEASA
jgi:hypothetical protein